MSTTNSDVHTTYGQRLDAGVVAELWRYPVKSMLGERCDELALGLDRCEGDHLFGVRDLATGMVLSAKRHGILLKAAARYEGSEVVISLPGGTEVVAGSGAGDAALSAWLGRGVEVIAPEPGVSYEFENNEPDQSDADPPWFTFPSAPGSLFDGRSSVHVILSSALARARALAPGADWDVRRFRPQLVLDDTVLDDTLLARPEKARPENVWPEEAWVGGEVSIGSEVVCVLTTRAQGVEGSAGLVRDREILRTLSDHADSLLGLYLDPVSVGRVQVGDAVTLSPAR